ncbi:Putative ribonuclease H protein At1g65750 [Linum perenne]
MLLGARSSIRNGLDTPFWTARWVDSGARLIDSIVGTVADVDTTETVADFTNEDGQWDVSRILEVLPPNVADSVFGMTPPRPNSGEDLWVWGGEANGRFSVKSAYKILLSRPSIPTSDMWMSVWRWRAPNRIRHFLWLAIQQKLLTNDERRRRNMTSIADCEFCRHPTESALHVLRDCSFAREVWMRVGGFDTSTGSWQRDAASWFRQGLNSDRGLLFGIVCWFIWKMRNERIFSNSRSTATSVAFRALNWCRVVTEAEERSVQNISIGRGRRTAEIAWEPGPEDWVTLNSDGSVDAQRGKAAAGGLVRNSEGRCLLAFSMNLGTCSVTRAELRGCYRRPPQNLGGWFQKRGGAVGF